MFPLLCMYPPDVPSLFVHTSSLLLSFFLLPNTFFFKEKTFLSLLLLQNLRVPVSFIISSCHLFLWTPFSCSSPFLFRLFSLLHFFNLVLSKKWFSSSKKSFSTSPKWFFWIFYRFEENLKNCSFNIHFLIFWNVRENVFSLQFVLKNILFFLVKDGQKQKLKFFQISLLVFLHVSKRISLFTPKKSWIETQKRVNREGKEVKPKREELFKKVKKSSKKWISENINIFYKCNAWT